MRYSMAVKDFIKENVSGTTTKELVILTNAKFGTVFTESRMKSYKTNHKLKSNTPMGNMPGASKVYSQAVQHFIKDNVTGRTNKELAERVNKKFGTCYTASQMNTYKKNHKLVSGLNFCFPKGHIPSNKGKKGYHAPGSEKGWFEKGRAATNKDPVGTEKLKADGYLWVKIADPNKWKQKHRIMWEEKNGPVPRGSCLLFGDGNRLNVTLENLILITRGQLSILNCKDLIGSEVEATKSGIIIADVYHQIAIKTKKLKKKARKKV